GPNGTCQNKSFDPSATAVIGASDAPALRFDTGFTGTSGNHVYIHDLTLRGPSYTAATKAACAFGSTTAGNETMLERVHLRDCNASRALPSLLENDGGTLVLSNLLVRDSQGWSIGGLMVASYDGGTSRISQVTVTGARAIRIDPQSSALYV